MKVNFKEIPFIDIEGNVQPFNCQKPIGNAVYMGGHDIEERDLGRMIYYADGEIELTNEQAEVVKRFVAFDSFVLTEATLKALTPDKP